jgi:hypothetical protein
MNTREHKVLLAEAAELERMLAETPEEFVIDRISLQSRLEEVRQELERFPQHFRQPPRSILTFNGAPVVRSHGVLADFGTKALAKFTDVLSMVAASVCAPLPVSGPIPNRDTNRVLITNTATGSFGFELEEDLSQLEIDTHKPTPVELGFEKTQALLESTLGSDDDLAEASADVDPRVIRALREYLDILAGADAVCAFEFRERIFRFRDVGEVRNSAARLSENNVHEEKTSLVGEFLGAVPHRRGFEFRLQDTGEIVYGKVDRSIDDAEHINDIRHQAFTISVRARWVGSSRPRYTLLELPDRQADATGSAE